MNLKSLIEQSSKLVKNERVSLYLKSLQQPELIRILEPIHFSTKNGKDLQILARNDIDVNKQILMVSTEKSITSAEFVGANNARANQLNDVTTQIAHKFYQQNIQQSYLTSGLLKLILQTFVHSQDQNLDMFPYCDYILSQNINSPLFWDQLTIQQIYSPYISHVINGTIAQCIQFNYELKDKRIHGISDHFFFKLFQNVRRNTICFTPDQPKYFDMNSVLIMSPLIDNVGHSFDPNCKVDGCYLSHDDQSFVELSSVKRIQKDEPLTINYGNLSNIDLLMRFGFLLDNNPHNQLEIDLNFDQTYETVSEMFELKQKLLRQSEIKDIEKLILFSNKINQEYLQYLRIYFLTEQDIQDNLEIASYRYKDFSNVVNKQNELRVCNFMIENLYKQLENYQINKQQVINYQILEMNQTKEVYLTGLEDLEFIKRGEFRNMLQLCLEEEEIVKKNISYLENYRREVNDK